VSLPLARDVCLRGLAVRRELCWNLGDAARSSGAIFSVFRGDTIGECDAFDDQRQLIGALQAPPCLCGGLDEFEDHELSDLPRDFSSIWN